jgi:hypothetical protein
VYAEYFINELEFEYESSIFYAAEKGWKEFLNLTKSKCFDIRDCGGWNILHYAAIKGKVSITLIFTLALKKSLITNCLQKIFEFF